MDNNNQPTVMDNNDVCNSWLIVIVHNFYTFYTFLSMSNRLSGAPYKQLFKPHPIR